jgi:hypothetical protein
MSAKPREANANIGGLDLTLWIASHGAPRLHLDELYERPTVGIIKMPARVIEETLLGARQERRLSPGGSLPRRCGDLPRPPVDSALASARRDLGARALFLVVLAVVTDARRPLRHSTATSQSWAPCTGVEVHPTE